MEEKSNSFDMLCLIISTKVKMQLKHKNRREMYGEGIVTDQMFQKVFAKFCPRDFSLDSTPQSGRPAEIYSHKIDTLRIVNIMPHER